MAAVQMWTSKLGNKYPMEEIQKNDAESQKELKRMRKLNKNDTCADCGAQGTSWASVTHGTFLCIVCSDVHRSVGTHITKIKGCTGTYLWGPDELEKMRSVGNQFAEGMYGTEKVSPHASKDAKQIYVVKKYQDKAFVSKSSQRATSPDAHPVTGRVEEIRHAVLAPRGEIASKDSKLGGVARNAAIPDSVFDDFFADFEAKTFAGSFDTAVPKTSIPYDSTFQQIDLLL